MIRKEKNAIRALTITLITCMLLTASAAGAFAVDMVYAASKTKKITQTISAPQNVRTYSGYKSVTVKWDAVSGAASYNIYRASGDEAFAKIGTAGSGALSFRDTGAKDNTVFTYCITAVAGGQESARSAESSAGCVRTINYLLKTKRGITVKSTGKVKKKQYFGAGEKLRADGFVYGYYLVEYNGVRYKVPWNKVRGAKADYKKNAYGGDGDNTAAENFVNEGQFGSKTKYLIWVSMYSQRLYVFKGSKGNWQCIRNCSCNTGRASTPTITGTNKKIYAKYKKNSKHKYWSRYTRYSSIHGRNKHDPKLGKPISGGCVRIDNASALFIMKKIPYKTRVISY